MAAADVRRVLRVPDELRGPGRPDELRGPGRPDEVRGPGRPDLAGRDAHLASRLARLPDVHPSARPHEAAARSALADLPGRLTDADHADRAREIGRRLADARAAGLQTDAQHTLDLGREVWSDDRDAAHEQIVADLYAAAAGIPCEGKAIIAGGLPGAGKTTVLREHAGIDLSRYFVINPDDIKEQLARRGLVPDIPGLSPMEASDLAHEESSHIAKRLANRAETDRRNIIWDITMSSAPKVANRAGDLRAAGYGQVDGIFVHVPIEVSISRAELRHRIEHDRYLSGAGLGGRYIPDSLIRGNADASFGSVNRRNFEQLKPLFDSWRSYDNSATGWPPRLVGADGPGRRDTREAN